MNILNDKNKLGSLLILTFALAYLMASFSIPLDTTANEAFNSRTLPLSLAVMTIFCCLLQLSQTGDADVKIDDEVKSLHWQPMLKLSVLMLVYAFIFDFLGFLPASFLFLFVGFFILGERRIILAILIAATLPFFMWLIMTQGFGLYLDAGDLYRLLKESF